MTDNTFLTIKPSSRSILYEGSLILGVKGDDCAQRIYFECPVNFNEIIGDLSDSSIKIYVEYKNAATEPYTCEITDLYQNEIDETKAIFSWLISSNVTYKAGDVSFNICIKKFNERNALVSEWRTTSFTGKVLDSVGVSKSTPEEITPDSETLPNVLNAVNALSVEFASVKKRTVIEMENSMDGTNAVEVGPSWMLAMHFIVNSANPGYTLIADGSGSYFQWVNYSKSELDSGTYYADIIIRGQRLSQTG